MKKKNQWFRLYADFATNPKIQTLHETLQRRYIMLLCNKCNNRLLQLDETELCFTLNISSEQLKETHEALLKKGLIKENWDIVGWEEKQYISDSSAERVRRHRAKKQSNVTVTLQDVTVKQSVTPPETETETETETDIKNICPSSADDEDDGFENFWNNYPRKVQKKAAHKSWKKLKPKPGLQEQISTDIQQRLKNRTWEPTPARIQYIPHAATYLNGERWKDEPEQHENSPGQESDWTQQESCFDFVNDAMQTLRERNEDNSNIFDGEVIFDGNPRINH